MLAFSWVTFCVCQAPPGLWQDKRCPTLLIPGFVLNAGLTLPHHRSCSVGVVVLLAALSGCYWSHMT